MTHAAHEHYHGLQGTWQLQVATESQLATSASGVGVDLIPTYYIESPVQSRLMSSSDIKSIFCVKACVKAQSVLED